MVYDEVGLESIDMTTDDDFPPARASILREWLPTIPAVSAMGSLDERLLRILKALDK